MSSFNWYSLFEEAGLCNYRTWKDKGNEYLVTVSLPGMEEVHVGTTSNGLLISGRAEGETVTQSYPLTLLSSQMEKIDTSAISAEYKKGLLRIHLPKRVSFRARDIPVTMLD